MNAITEFPKPATRHVAQSGSSAPKALIIDSDVEEQRKARIAALKKLGLRVYPALNMREARSRLKPGRFALIVIRAAEDPALAAELCESIRQSDSAQPLLLLARPEDSVAAYDFVIPENPETLAERATRLLGSKLTTGGLASAA